MTHTGTDTGTARRTVEPAHARALAEHGPGWAIMWDDRHDQPVIIRPERGDDGTLLEICPFEHMFGLGGFCDRCGYAHTCDQCVPSGPSGFEVIAAHMTDILGDYYLDRADIAAHMPLTLPYTRALAEHGIRRRFQGTRHGDTFYQRYVSPDDRHFYVIIPINPPPADAPAPALTIEWIYLRPHPCPYTTDHPAPQTHIPADTPPADIAELIVAHLAIHPPATRGMNAPENRAHLRGPVATGPDTTDDTDGPDSPTTPATA
ncbi:hypothetical protein ACFWY5_57055 [Nonomuraea sp. NPDC059007]|uniref:hypothetical protein n=1 Tax=Nonomuraea sp. NPDC059007 TaxID=3346692 RepID=UPI003680658A